MNPEIIGSVAASLTTAAFLPQLLKVLKERDTKGISLGMYVVFNIGVALWLVYGYMIESRPIVVANTVTLAMSSTILYMKLRLG